MPIAPRIIAEVYRDPEYRGKKVTILDSVPDTTMIGCNDMISSIKIFRGPGFNSAPNFKAIFYEHPNYTGRRIVLPPGFYPNVHDIPYSFGDIISSVQFGPSMIATGPDYGVVPIIVDLYQDRDLQGMKGTVLNDVSNMRDIGLDRTVSSIKITRGPNFPPTGCRVIFFEQPNFEGASFSLSLGRLQFGASIPDLHLHPQRFGDVISSVKISPTGIFNVLIVLGDTRSVEPAILAGLTDIEGNIFRFNTVMINANPGNYGDPNGSISLASLDLSEYDIVWFAWNAPGHDKQYFLENSEVLIRDFVTAGGTVWASAMDDNINENGTWRGNWLPVETHPIRVVGSEDANVTITPAGIASGLFSWPNKVDPNVLITDDHWVTEDPIYRILATRRAVIRVLVVVGDNRTREHEILNDFTVLSGNNFSFETIFVNSNMDNFGVENASRLGSVDFTQYDVVWFTHNATGHDREYFIADADILVKNFVARGGVVWASGMDDNILEGKGWRGTWIPIDIHPIRVSRSKDTGILITAFGNTSGLFTSPSRINVDAFATDQHWITSDRAYQKFAIRRDNNDAAGIQLRWGAGFYLSFALDTGNAEKSEFARPLLQNALNYISSLVKLKGEYVSFQLKWGKGHYVTFALDARDPASGQIAKPLIQNALYYLAGLAWQTSPRQLHGLRREVMTHSMEY